MRVFFAQAIVIAIVAAGGCSTVGQRVPGIDNFYTVHEGILYRGAQPTRLGVETLANRSIRTVINLRDDPLPWEKDELEKAGIRYISIPTVPQRSDPAEVARFLDAVKTADKPVFVHCRYGCDRTGLEVAMYRITAQNWSRDDAIKDLRAHGYHWALYPNIESFIRGSPLP